MKKKNVLFSILAFVVIAVVLFLLFRNKTKEGYSGSDFRNDGWQLVTTEGEKFVVKNPRGERFRYGSLDGRGSFEEKKFSMGQTVKCSNQTFGDPVPGKKKGCYVENKNYKLQKGKNAKWQTGYTLIAVGQGNNNRSVRFAANGTIRYGALDGTGEFVQKKYSQGESVMCSNSVFGDPALGKEKGCYIKYDNTLANMKLKMNEQLAQAQQKNPAAFVGIKDIGNSFRCKRGTKPVGQEYAADERHIYRGEYGNKLKHYESKGAALLYGGGSYRKSLTSDGWRRPIVTIDCGTKTYGGKHKCDESGKGQEYRGCKNTTRKGSKCRLWDAGGNGGSRNYIKNLFNDERKVEEYGLGSGTGKYKMANNFCRTPVEKDGNREKKPWCYASGVREKGGWGYCF